jgi:hypothetical protein
MASNRNFTNFRAVYDDLTDEVARARPQFMADHIDNWFALIDETPMVLDVVRALEASVGFDRYDFMNRIKPSSAAMPSPPPLGRKGGPLAWPANRDKRLGLQLEVFREIAKRNLSVVDFGRKFIEGADEKEAAKLAIEQAFSPMARDLRRRLEASLGDREDLTVPASDRLVKLDHNSAAYTEATDALAELEETLRGTNDFGDVEEKEQRIAEVSAARRVLQAVRVRVEPVVTLLQPIAIQFGTKLKDTLLGMAVSKAMGAVGTLIGYVFKAVIGG